MRSPKARTAAAPSARDPRRSDPRGSDRTQATLDEPTCLSIYDGQRCVGHLILRGRQGVEAFDADDRSLGIFPDQKAAVAAIPVGGRDG